jgi:hypothetical protein
MEWLRSHPYGAALAAAAVVVIIGAIIVERRSPAALSSSTLTWSGGAAITPYQNGSPSQQSLTPEQIAQEVIQGQAGQSAPLPTLAPATTSAVTPNSGSFDYVALLEQISASSSAKTTPTGGSSSTSILSQAYQFIPQGLIATAPSQKSMAAEQQALYLYGNSVGGEIQSFETLHTNEAQVLKDQAEDRTDPIKADAVVSLGEGLASIGTYMQGMQDVPPSAAALHASLAQSYLDIGAKLQLVAKAQNDVDFVQAVENYDSAADTFVHNYAALAQFFSAQGVVFSAQDPGSVFSFSDTGGGGL